MNKVAGKYFLPVFLGSVLVFAIDFGNVNIVTASSNYIERHENLNSFNGLDDDGFWGKFRESVMKDRDGNDPHNEGSPEPSRGGEMGGHDRGGEPGGDGGHGHDHGGRGEGHR